MHIVHVMLGFADVHSIHIADLAELLHQISPDADTAEAMDFYSGGLWDRSKKGRLYYSLAMGLGLCSKNFFNVALNFADFGAFCQLYQDLSIVAHD